MSTPGTALLTERALLAQLLAVLQQEQSCLVGADIDALTALTARKGELVQQMADAAALRHQLLGAAGYPAADAGMTGWLAAHGDAASAELWQELLAQARDAKELNRVNGMLVNKHLAHNQARLQELSGPAEALEAGLYGPGGQTGGTPRSRRLIVG